MVKNPLGYVLDSFSIFCWNFIFSFNRNLFTFPHTYPHTFLKGTVKSLAIFYCKICTHWFDVGIIAYSAQALEVVYLIMTSAT